MSPRVPGRTSDQLNAVGIRTSSSGKPFNSARQVQRAAKQLDVLDKLAEAIGDSKLPQRILKRVRASSVRFPASDGFYVYVLLGQGSEVLYAGQTTNVFRRVGQHLDDGKKFTTVNVFPCESKSHMDLLEREMIRAFQPPLNKILYGG